MLVSRTARIIYNSRTDCYASPATDVFHVVDPNPNYSAAPAAHGVDFEARDITTVEKLRNIRFQG